MFYMVLNTYLRINLLQQLDVTVITAQHLFLENAYLLYQLILRFSVIDALLQRFIYSTNLLF